MTHVDWSKLCGPGQNLTIFDSGTFGQCFQQLAIVCPTHLILAVISAYMLIKHRNRQVQGRVPHSPTLHVRFSASLGLLIAPLLLYALIIFWKEHHPSVIDMLAWGIRALTWLLHSGFIWKLRKLYHIHIRGSIPIILSFMLTTASTVVQLYTVIKSTTESPLNIANIEKYMTFVIGGLHSIYLLTLVSWRRPQLTLSAYQPINESTERQVQSRFQGYGSITLPREDLGRAEDGASCVSKLMFWWVNPLMFHGYRGNINDADDLFKLPNSLNTRAIDIQFSSKFKSGRVDCAVEDRLGSVNDTSLHDRYQDQEVTFQSRGKPTMSLLQALNKTFGCEYYSLGILKFIGDGLGFAGPIILNLLVKYMEDANEPVWHGYVYASALFLATLISSLASTHFNYRVQVVGLKIRAAIITMVYRKSLGISLASMSKSTTGEIVNYMSTDTDRIVNFCPSFHSFWSLPVQTAVSLYLLYDQVKWSFLAGLVFIILLIPLNRWLAIKIVQLSNEMMAQKDARVKVMNEILCGIRVIKMFAWEDHFTNNIGKLRNAELKSLKGRKYLDAMCVYFWATTPVLISILTFTTYALLGNTLTAAKVFTSIALFVMLITPLNAFPWVVNGLMESWVSVKRLQKFLELEELDWNKFYKHSPDDENDAVDIKCASLRWGDVAIQENSLEQSSESRQSPAPECNNTCQSQQSPHGNRIYVSESPAHDDFEEGDSELPSTGALRLNSINLKVEKGMLVGVIGKVGSGKSSILHAILGEMELEEGDVAVNNLHGGFGLVNQEPWIQHATVMDNILFGLPYDADFYDEVIESCALREDLKMLPAGDHTEIGENGINLSGGQKARVAFARAVYQNKDMYLLDDPLAAVDPHVAKHLFEHCIMGTLRDKTRVLCTHHTQFLRSADLVVVMDQGEIIRVGQPDEVLDHLGGLDGDGSRTRSPKTKSGPGGDEDSVGNSEVVTQEPGGLVQEEEKDTGVVKLHVYKLYWNAVGSCLAISVLLSLLLMQASRNITDWWLSYWVTHSHSGHGNGSISYHSTLVNSIQSHTDIIVSPTQHAQPWANVSNAEDNVKYYLMVYGCLAASNSVFTFARAFLFAYGGICAARKVHNLLLASILKAPVSFFDVTPIGRILNRFSSDVYSLDDSLPFIMNIFFAQLYGVFGTLAITCYGLPWFTVVLFPLAIIYYFIQKYYRRTSRDIKRITSVSLSPIYAHFSETLRGLSTIRALRHIKRFEDENLQRLDENQCAQYASLAASQWLAIRLQMIGVAMVSAVALIAVLEHHFKSVNPGLVGLAMSYALSVTGLLSGVVTSFTETEKQMVSMERACQYIDDVPQETSWATLNVPSFWPIQGSISFQNVYLRYHKNQSYALRNVCFETKPGEKIGIVGRTGSGKSSLFSTLFRLTEIEKGQILIDGINIGHLELKELRSHLAIIPQDPFLYAGTIRDNLDPTRSYSGGAIKAVLQACHLWEAVEGLGGVMVEVGERGCVLSVGQRQLLCLARALLTRAKVLCIDEATASVDQETDLLIQETIRTEFVDQSVLTIAHRIKTISDSDRILVMQDGEVSEFAPPDVLLKNPSSLYYSLVHGRPRKEPVIQETVSDDDDESCEDSEQ